MEKAEVKTFNGAPALFIDGKPSTGLAFFCCPVGNEKEEARLARKRTDEFSQAEKETKLACKRMREFGQAGVRIYSFVLGLDSCWVGDGAFRFDEVDRILTSIIDADAHALLLPRVIIDAPQWWREKYTDELGKQWNRQEGEFVVTNSRQSFSSQRWQRDAGDALRRYVQHLEGDKFSGHILGYLPSAGLSHEWSYGWGGGIHEFNAVQTRGFRRWLRDKYKDDIAGLRIAWKEDNAGFDTAAIPSPQRRCQGDVFEFFDPSLGRQVPDYLEYHNQAVSDAILYFAEIVKDETRGNKLCGVFYGYYFFHGDPSLLNVGHRTMKKVLDSPHIDFLSAPHNYRERQVGGVLLSQAVTGSIRLNGKLYYDEDDTRTFLSPKDASYGRADTLAETVEVLKRNFAAVMAEGGTQWWMEQSAGWFSHPEILGLIKKMKKMAGQLLECRRERASEIAVIVSDQSTYYLRHSTALLEPLIFTQMIEEMPRIGAPFDTYIADDLAHIPEYKLYIFLNTPFLTPSQLKAVRERILGSGHTVLWVYAPGFVTEEGLSTAAMSELMGIELAFEKSAGRPRLAITNFEHPITRELPRGIQFSTPEKIGPLFWCADTEAISLGEIYAMFGLYKTGLAVKEIKGGAPEKDWKSVWCGVPNLPSYLLRGIARFAGVHIYSDANDALYANNVLLAVHTRYAGLRTIRLPKPMNVIDAFTGDDVARGASSFQAHLDRGCTGCWLLT
ncbi:hypothetical protein ACFLQR_03265 [Verrucomicrobiota bacterium]